MRFTRLLMISGLGVVTAAQSFASTAAPPAATSTAPVAVADAEASVLVAGGPYDVRIHYRNREGRRRREVERYVERARTPTAGFGVQVAGWEPRDVGETDALIRGHMRAYLNRQAAIQGEIGYWSHGNVGPSSDRIRDIPVGASMLVFLRPSYGWHARGAGASLYGGVGVDWHNLEETLGPSGPDPEISDSATGFGYHVIGGLEIGNPAGANIFLEYRYTSGSVDDLNGLPFDFGGSSLGGGIGMNF